MTLFERLGLPDPRKHDVLNIEWLGFEVESAQRRETEVEGGPSYAGVRIASRIGTFGFIRHDDKYTKSIVDLDSNTLPKSYIDRVANPAKSSKRVDRQGVVADREEVKYIRGCTDLEEYYIREVTGVEDEIMSLELVSYDDRYEYILICKEGEYTLSERFDILSFDARGEISSSSTSCNSWDYGYCAYTLVDSAAYCGLAGYACTPSVIAGPAGLAACFAAVASICVARGAAMIAASTCPKIYDCLVEWCENNPDQCEDVGFNPDSVP